MKPFKALLTTWAFFPVLASGGIAFTGNDDAIRESPDVTQNQKKINVAEKCLEHILIIIFQPYVADWFSTPDKVLTNALETRLKHEVKMSYEYLGGRNITNPEFIERFVDTGIARKQEGTGLGLSITKKLLKLMGGSIRVESELGKGSAFAILLPIKKGG
jgi:K+-sensing histidine kinase KdpD